MNTPTPTPAAELSDAAIAQAWRDIAEPMKGSGHHDDFIWRIERLAQQIEATRDLPASAPKAECEGSWMGQALHDFTQHFVKNYPGPDTVIHDPTWHAPRLFRNALHHIEEAQKRDALTRELPAASLGEVVAFRFRDKGPKEKWSNWHSMDDLVHYGPGGNLVDGPHPEWEVEYAYAPAPSSAGEGDWPEDFAHENGNYSCRCVTCGNEFIGHKRRVVCRKCHTPKPEAGAVGDGPGVLVAFAKGRIQHLNRGSCPDEIEGHDSRDPACPVCTALARSEGVA